jgi:urease accessory protein
VLAGRHSEAPFGAVRANYLDGSGIPEVQITNPSGGILGGDRLEAEVTLEPGSAATVLTQAAAKAYRGTSAYQRAVFRVGEGAFLEYLPHHLIPFAGSRYRQETEFHLAASATLVAWEAFSAGRIARGERFAFGCLAGTTRIFREDFPEVVDGFEIPGGGEPFGGYSYLGSLYVRAPVDLSFLAEELHASLSGSHRLFASASVPAPRLCAVRALAQDSTALYRALNGGRAEARKLLALPPPPREIR